MMFGTVYQTPHISVFRQFNGTIAILDEDGKVLLIVFGTNMATIASATALAVTTVNPLTDWTTLKP